MTDLDTTRDPYRFGGPQTGHRETVGHSAEILTEGVEQGNAIMTVLHETNRSQRLENLPRDVNLLRNDDISPGSVIVVVERVPAVWARLCANE